MIPYSVACEYQRFGRAYCPYLYPEAGSSMLLRYVGTYIPDNMSYPDNGRAIAQVVSRRLPTAAALVRAHVRSCGICGGESGTAAGFLRVLRFPLQILIPPTAPHSSSSIILAWNNRPISGRRTKWTQSHPTQRN
jgi:hypothetical protein